MTRDRFTPMGCGAGLRSKHYSFILSEWPKMDWFEAVTENFMDTEGRPLSVLQEIRSHYPVALHGVSLSIGSADPLDEGYLAKLKLLAKRIDPFVVSDHLCWTGVDGENLHDLLPLPQTEEALTHVVRRVGRVQEVLGRRILLENISSYVTYRHSVVPEWEFLREVARRSGCGILLDLNNIFVNSVNHRFDPAVYLREIPGEWVGQFHLAGHTDKGPYLFDTHSAEVVEGVWKLYRQALDLYGPVSTLIEWDEAIPDFERLSREVEKARVIYRAAKGAGGPAGEPMPLVWEVASGPGLAQTQRSMKRMIRRRPENRASILNDQGGSPGEERMAVYADGYVSRLYEALAEVYEAVHHFTGREAFIALTEAYAEESPSKNYNLSAFGGSFPEFIQKQTVSDKLPFLPDLSRLERSVHEAFHAAVSAPFDPSAVTAGDLDWEKARIAFQPSVSVVSSRWPILDLWRARKTPLSELDIPIEGRPQRVMVYRSGLDVRCEEMDEAQAGFIQSLKEGHTIGECCERLAENDQEPPLEQWFGKWNQLGVITNVG